MVCSGVCEVLWAVLSQALFIVDILRGAPVDRAYCPVCILYIVVAIAFGKPRGFPYPISTRSSSCRQASGGGMLALRESV